MTIRFTPNTLGDLYLARAAPPSLLDSPEFPNLPVQQYPPYFSYNFDQVEFASTSPISFFLTRGLMACPVPIHRATATLADWLIIDPLGAQIVVRLLSGDIRVQPPTEFLIYWIGRDNLSY